MAFELKSIVPWGRNLSEYINMFSLTEAELKKKIISFGDGPASFNCEMNRQGKNVISIDPIYLFSKEELQQRIVETKDIVIEQTKNNIKNFVWKHIKNIQELEQIRMSAMSDFLQDYEPGKKQGRYIHNELPNKIEFDDLSFDLGLSSHFLLLYDKLGLEFHIESIAEMLRVCKKIKIFPLLNLDAQKSRVLDGIIKHFQSKFEVTIKKVNYEFQKGGDEMLILKHPST